MSPVSPYRLTRAVAFAAVCVSLTLGGHWAASGDPLSPWAITAAFLGVTGLVYMLAGVQRGLPVIFGGLLGGQFTLHALLAVGTEHHAPLEAANSLSPRMTFAHFMAAVVSAWWLQRGERGAWALARTLASPFLLAALDVRIPVRPVPPQPLPAAPARPAAVLLRYVLVLRGPPARSLAL